MASAQQLPQRRSAVWARKNTARRLHQVGRDTLLLACNVRQPNDHRLWRTTLRQVCSIDAAERALPADPRGSNGWASPVPLGTPEARRDIVLSSPRAAPRRQAGQQPARCLLSTGRCEKEHPNSTTTRNKQEEAGLFKTMVTKK
jgi:hypothetical protein